MFTQTMLIKRRRWTQGLINQFMEKPDEEKTNPHNPRTKMKLYERKRVYDIEKTQEFQDAYFELKNKPFPLLPEFGKTKERIFRPNSTKKLVKHNLELSKFIDMIMAEALEDDVVIDKKELGSKEGLKVVADYVAGYFVEQCGDDNYVYEHIAFHYPPLSKACELKF